MDTSQKRIIRIMLNTQIEVYYIQIPLHKSTLFAFHVVLSQICAWYSISY